MPYSIKQKLGAAGIDLPRFEWRLRRNWTLISNRSELLEAAPDHVGIRCDWQWTSELHLAKVFPSTGRRLLQRALRDWPIGFAEAPISLPSPPLVAFIIGHRGTARLPHLLATLRTIAAQRGVCCECIVVEQSDQPQIRQFLPSWARYVHTRPAQPGMPYCRSWTLNVGARLAQGPLLVFHDNDMLVPEYYAAELWRRYQEGYEIINLKRFVFYLNEFETSKFFETTVLAPNACSEAVVQNLEAGGSVAAGRDAFLAIGGFDESFVGWGGEDNEFWDRAQTRRVWPYGHLPIVHLWHAAQPRKTDPANPTLRRYAERLSMAPESRIAQLRSREFGRPDALSADALP